MKDKTKRVTIDETTYEIKRFRADVGSFILGRILSAGARAMLENMKALGDIQPPTSAVAEPQAQADPDHESRIKQMAMSAFGVMSFDEHAMLQRKCLEVCSRIEAEETPMPLATANGTLVDDFELAMRLELETLVFNFIDFFAAGGPNAFLKTPAPRS